MNKLTDNRAAMIRSYINKGHNCDCFYPLQFELINYVIQNKDKDALHVIKNILINRIDFMELAIKHYNEAIQIISNIEKK
jgi:hypothetical protein